MSDEHLDNDLKGRIKQVFDHYEDDTAQEGWLLLREKYPEKKKDRPVIWLWRLAGAAAILMIFLRIGLWLNIHGSNEQRLAYHAKAPNTNKAVAVKAADKMKESNRINSQPPADSALAVVANGQQGSKRSAIKNGITRLSSTPTTLSNTAQTVNTAVPVNKMAGGNGWLASTGAKAAPQAVNARTSAHVDLLDSMAKRNLAGAPHTAQALAVTDSPSAKNNAEKQTALTSVAKGQQGAASPLVSKGMQSLFDHEAKNNTVQNTEEQQFSTQKVAFGIYAATYMNYAKGSNKQFNTGAGITSDIKLTQNLSLSTGISLAQNTLNYSNTGGSNASALQAAVRASSLRSVYATASVSPLLVPASANLNANLVGLDIPVNLKYVFNPQKGNTYVAAGLSSGTFINETYTTSYSYVNGGSSSVQQSEDATHKAFDNFYLAKMLNFSFGVGYPVGRNQLILEPFFKYPLNGLGDQHILFGSGGVNLKFNFDPPKRKNPKDN